MAASLLQSNQAHLTVTNTQVTCAYTSSLTPGSLLVAYVGSASTTRTFTASDGTNGAWNTDIGSNGGAGSTAIMTFPNNTSSGTPTVTAVMSGAAGIIQIIIEEWAGVQTTTPLDQTIASTVASGTTGTGGTTGALSQTNELVLSVLQLNGTSGATFTVAAPFTQGPQGSNPALPSSLLTSGYNLPGGSQAAQTCTFNWTTARTGRGATASYKTVQLGQIAPFYSRKYILFNT